MRIKATLFYIIRMNDEAWYIFIRSLQLCCALLLFSVCFLIECESRGGCHIMRNMAVSLFEIPQSLLLIAGIASACIDDLSKH